MALLEQTRTFARHPITAHRFGHTATRLVLRQKLFGAHFLLNSPSMFSALMLGAGALRANVVQELVVLASGSRGCPF